MPDRILMVADSHIGSKDTDIKLIYEALNYAASNFIYNIIMAGDMIQGSTCKESMTHYPYMQMEYFVKNFQDANLFNFYYLFGNHEANMQLSDQNYFITQLNSVKNITYMGNEDTYIYQNDSEPLAINHFIPYRKNGIAHTPIIKTDYRFDGHHHCYLKRDFDNTRIYYIPALSRVNNSITQDSGFIELIGSGDLYHIIYKKIMVIIQFILKKKK